MTRIHLLSILFLTALVAPSAAADESFDCLMDPSEVVELGSPVPGLLNVVYPDLGDTVEKGQVVAQLVSAIEQSTVALLELRASSTSVIEATERQVAMMQKRYDRIAKLAKRGFTAQDVLDQIEGELISSQSQLVQARLSRDLALKELERAKIQLEQRTIKSPIDGVIRKRVLVGGEYVDTNDHILKIVRLDPLRVEAFVPVSLFGKVRVGDQAVVRPSPPLDGEHLATVISVDPVFDAASATFVMVLEVPNPDEELPAGHRCSLELSNKNY